MPKLVDHPLRREQLAAALWRLVLREGIEAASIRRVAAEAGWSTGSLRHYFADQSELLSFAMDLVVRRVTERMSRLGPEPDPRRRAQRMLEEVLPLDAARHTETRVWLAFTARSLVSPDLRSLRDDAHAGLRALCRHAVELLGVADPARESERLHALIDGLALHAVLTPDVTTPARQVELLAAHLDALARAGHRARGS